LIRRLAAVIRAWVTRRLLWVWLFAYACVLTSASFWPVSPRDTYFECPRSMLPRNATDLAAAFKAAWDVNTPALPKINMRDLIVRRDPNETLDLKGWKDAPKEIPALEQLFVGGFRNDPSGFRSLREALPGIRVWHLDLNGGRLASTVFLLLATLTLGGAVMQQLQATFSLPQARMYPKYAASHLTLPLVVCAIGIVAAALISREFGTDFWAAASVQVLGWAGWFALEFLPVSLLPNIWRRHSVVSPETGSTTRPDRAGWIRGAVVVLVIAATYLIFVEHPYVLESFLLGELPWLSAAFLTVGAALGVAAIVAAPKLSIVLNEAGIAPVLSMQDLEKRRPSPYFSTPLFRRRLDHLRRPSRAHTWWWRLHAMQCGNPDLLMPVLIKIVGPVVVLSVCARFLPFGMFAQSFVMLLLAVGWIAALSSCFSIWWQRRKAFSMQLLYPWTRRQMTRSAFAAYALDTAGLPVAFCATFVVCNWVLDWRLGTHLILTGVVVAIGMLSLLVAGGLWLLTLRHRLLASFLAFVGVVVLIAWICVSWRNHTLTDTRYLLAVGLLLAGQSTLLLALTAYRRWMTREWGLFGP
jgi:hypothetical protein